MNALRESNIKWNEINDYVYNQYASKEDRIHMTKKCTEAGVDIIRTFSGKKFECDTDSITELSRTIEKHIIETMGYKPKCSLSTLRRHGLIKLAIINNKGYAAFTKSDFGEKRAKNDYRFAISGDRGYVRLNKNISQ